jgi:hypothetical protein
VRTIEVDLTQVPPGIEAAAIAGRPAHDIVADHSAGAVGDNGRLSMEVEALTARTIVITRGTR